VGTDVECVEPARGWATQISTAFARKQEPRREVGLAAVELTLSPLASGQRVGFFGLMGFVTGSFSDPALATDEVA